MDRHKSKCKFLADRRRIQLDSSFLFVPQTLGELCFPDSSVDISFQICYHTGQCFHLLILQSIFFCSNLFLSRSHVFSMNFHVAASAFNVYYQTCYHTGRIFTFKHEDLLAFAIYDIRGKNWRKSRFRGTLWQCPPSAPPCHTCLIRMTRLFY